jgi:mono/diheme cytochrome c family protein
LLVFLILVALAYFIGAPLEAQADPADTSYTPRPEWYFLFLFQLLKYFPGRLEVIGVFIIPSLAILALIALPFLDQSAKRHFFSRPVVTAVTSLAVLSVILLTALSVLEAPPPAEEVVGDPIANLYTQNCATCHGPRIEVKPGISLHDIIAEGSHEGMPAWGADLTTDEIDALAGFILSPRGNTLFVENCGTCHDESELVAGDPIELKRALEEGPGFSPHQDLEIPNWQDEMSAEERTALLNFLVAPDGQRLFAVNCASCHGRAVAFSGEEAELRSIISQGGMHLEMPPWRETLSDSQLDTLTKFVVNPSGVPEGQEPFDTFCADCHGERIPAVENEEIARQVISGGGAHETMPVWGEILTDEQLDALVIYTFQSTQGAPIALGQQIFAENCAVCHGDFGEGGINPARADDVIAPISSEEYLTTRDDSTLRLIIAKGQPNFGMSPFGTAFGGPLDEEQIDAVVAYMRSWEADPPVEFPPALERGSPASSGRTIFMEICASCHGDNGQGVFGPALVGEEFETSLTDQEIFDVIKYGHEATEMVAWGEILSSDQIDQLVQHIRSLTPAEGEEPTPSGAIPSFANDLVPILEAECVACHGTLGGWDASTYNAFMNTGNNAPVVIPGDPEESLLAQKLLGTQTEGTIMPPSGKLADDLIQLFLDWITAGAPDN